jgi:hypothetical protein
LLLLQAVVVILLLQLAQAYLSIPLQQLLPPCHLSSILVQEEQPLAVHSRGQVQQQLCVGVYGAHPG